VYILSIIAGIVDEVRGPGCVVDLRVPEANLAAARQAVEDLNGP